MVEGQMRAAECDLKRLKMGDQIARAETTSANGWPDGKYFSGEAGGSGRLTAGCGAGRAYIGLGDDGSVGNGDEGSEGTDGRLPLYKKMSEESVV